jgi:hypothetical protein
MGRPLEVNPPGLYDQRPDRRDYSETAWFLPAPERKKTTTWHEFIRIHMDMLVATDFFTTEVWTWCGLVTYYVLFFIRLGTREVHVAGVTPHPDQLGIRAA